MHDFVSGETKRRRRRRAHSLSFYPPTFSLFPFLRSRAEGGRGKIPATMGRLLSPSYYCLHDDIAFRSRGFSIKPVWQKISFFPFFVQTDAIPPYHASMHSNRGDIEFYSSSPASPSVSFHLT